MTRVIALANEKGGVGKTTTAISLGAAVAERGHQTLIIDIDPQANATAGLGLRGHEGASTYELFLDQASLPDVVQPTAFERLSVAPAVADLAGAEIELTAMMAREYRLRRATENHISRYAYVFIDCPPSVGLLTVNGLTAATELIVPVQCEYLALEGLGQFTRTVDLVRRNLNPGLRITGLLLTMFDKRTSLSQQVADEVRKHFPNTFRTVVPRSVRLSEAPSHGLPIGAYDARSSGAIAYSDLADELLASVSETVEVT
jgi:chromosome partitioning protein